MKQHIADNFGRNGKSADASEEEIGLLKSILKKRLGCDPFFYNHGWATVIIKVSTKNHPFNCFIAVPQSSMWCTSTSFPSSKR